jgi:hypothetical protein
LLVFQDGEEGEEVREDRRGEEGRRRSGRQAAPPPHLGFGSFVFFPSRDRPFPLALLAHEFLFKKESIPCEIISASH